MISTVYMCCAEQHNKSTLQGYVETRDNNSRKKKREYFVGEYVDRSFLVEKYKT